MASRIGNVFRQQRPEQCGPPGDCPNFRVSDNGTVPFTAVCREFRPASTELLTGPPPEARAAAGRFTASRAARIAGLLTAVTVGLAVAASCERIAMGQAGDDSDRQAEYNVKLAYLCNFTRYVTWPADGASKDDGGEWIIGVLGEDPFRGALDRVAASGRKVAGRKLAARHFASLKDYKPCHILFVPKSVPRKQQDAVVPAMQGKPVLVVGEIAGFATAGGCVNFFFDDDNVRFEINVDALKAQHLEASSKLLALAKIVKRP
jgi:hypothetical protein